MGLNYVKRFKKLSDTLFLGVIFLALWVILGAGSMQVTKDEVEVTGRIYVMGNEPFTQVGIELDNGKVFALVGKHDKELRGLQGKRLTVKGMPAEKTTRRVDAIEVKSFQIMEPK